VKDRLPSRPRWLHSRSDLAVVASTLLLLVLAAVVTIVAFDRYTHAVEEQAERAMIARAESRRAEIEAFLDARRADAQILAARLEALPGHGSGTPGYLDPAQIPTIQRMFRETAASYHYRDIRLVAPDGRTVQSLIADIEESVEVVAFQRTIASGEPRLVDIHTMGDETAFGVVQPLASSSARAHGAVFLEINIGESLSLLITERPGTTATEEALLTRVRDGALDILTPTRLSHPDRPHPPPPDEARPVAEQLRSLTATARVAGADYRGEYVIGAATPVTGTGWRVLVKRDENEIAAPVTAMRGAMLTILVALVAFLLFGARMTWRARQGDLLAARLLADNRYRAAIDASIDGYFVADDSGTILEANDALLGMLGYTREAFLGRHVRDVQARLTPEQCDEQLTAIRAAGEVRLETRWAGASGHPIDLAVSLIYLPNSDGGTFHGFVHDIGPEIAVRSRIERLNAFYRFLSHANAAIFSLSDPQEILDAVCRTAVRDGGFVLVWAGFADNGTDSIRPATAHGEATDYLRTLQITIDPVLPTSRGPTRECMTERRIVSVDDFQSDPSTAPWHEKGRRYGIRSSAAVPIIVDGTAIAVMTFYSRERGYFDAELRDLLEETARNVSLGLEAVTARRARQAAEAAHRESEERFQRVFEASPFPMHIWSLPDLKLRAVNRAHERLLGYTREEVEDPETWGDTIYTEPGQAEAIRATFTTDVAQLMAGGPGAVVESPEIVLRCKSGERRTVKAFMTLAGRDLVLQWLDLTEIKRRQADLVEGERRFRGMIEQTFSGVYVAMRGRIVYANPRLEAILGYDRGELIDRDPIDLVDEQARAEARRLEARVLAGSHGVSGSLEARRKDGSQIVVGLHATRGTWDGEPADIVMVQDVTESKRAEEKIAAYVVRLEGTMRGTLQAVANMVDLRDPYTSGHERRVGIIAGDIARELGWPAEQCEHLKLIGLVHDIGKIAIPAEILSKPAKLTPLEYSLIKSHAEKGFEILKDVDFPLPIAEIIRDHHERMDGSGYPRGLKGDDIRMEARIIAVADVIEAMASHRPYRPSLGIDAALAEIEAHRGVWFDATVVDAALRLVREKGYVLPT
jgi:PAS domain S-box-containing protein/putative nucleotidyltransferase with HDIG domain